MYCVIMAGGSGTRFWPLSREEQSKQFLTFFGRQSLIQSTVCRFHTFGEWDTQYVVAKKSQESLLSKNIPEIPKKNFLFEPLGRNTAACIGLAAIHIRRRDPDGILVISPSDHLVQNENLFRRAVLAAVRLARGQDVLVTIGIVPDRPATGYGYIQIDKPISELKKSQAYSIKTFAEKPNLETAERFLSSGDFLWNSGMFVFRIPVFLNAVAEWMPELHDGLMEIERKIGKTGYASVLEKVYRQVRNVSIDYGIMEKAKNVCVVKGEFSWSDLGSWEQVYKMSPKNKDGNAVSGEAVMVDVQNSYVYSSKGLVTVLGLDNIIVIQDRGAVMVCHRDRAEDVKKLVERLRTQNFKKFI